MKRFKYYIVALIWLFFGKLTSVVSSSPLTYPEELNEKIVLFTDRNYYAVNETVYFKAFNNSHPLVKEKNWSKVLYIELVNDDGIAAYKGKYNLSQSGADGSLIIPSDMPTGYYFLIGYTKWMRNFSPLDFAFVKLCIVNPNRPYIDASEKQDNYSDSIISGQTTLLDISKDKVNCHVNKPVYSKREEVSLTLDFPVSYKTSTNTYCISVIKKAAIDTVNYGIINSGITISENSEAKTNIPELYGMTLSGSIVSTDNSEPSANTDVQLSVLGNNIDYFNSKTDSGGRFVFSLQPTCYKNEMFISFENENQLPSKIIIDDDYFSNTFSFRGHPFLLSEEEVRIAEETMFNMQVNKAFYSPDIDYRCYDTTISHFYGPPSKTIEIKDFIDLPSLYEVFFEIVPEVMVLKKKGVPYLQVVGKVEYHPEFALFEPLVMVDNIPITNIEDMLNISPQRISHIEIVREIYIKGDNKFGGIINIFSEKGDLAGIKLPESSMFLNFNGFTPQPDRELVKTDITKSHNPDYRNSLFWEPNFIPESYSGTQIKFFTSDITGEYVVIIRGLSENGNIIVGTTNFSVE